MATPSPAQPVFSPPPSAQLIPASMRSVVGSAAKAPPLTGIFSPPRRAPSGRSLAANQATPFTWGPFSLKPGFTESFTYNEGLQSQPGRPTSTYTNSFSPGFVFDFGRNIVVAYNANWTIYTGNAFKESLDHSLNVAGGLTLRDWATTFSQSYSTTSAPLISTGRQTQQESVGTTLGLSRRLGDRLSVTLSAAQSLSFVGAAPDSYAWNGSGQLQYIVSDKLDLGTGLTISYTDMDPGVNTLSVNPTLQASWHPSEKLTFSANGGEQIQQSFSRGVPVRYTPVFGISANYSPFENTSIGVSANRTIAPSLLRNQMTDSTSWSTNFSQRLLGHFNFSANYGEQEAGYVATNLRVTAGRKDKSYSYSFSLGTTFLRRGSINLNYAVSHNASSASGFGFNSSQIGTSIGFRY